MSQDVCWKQRYEDFDKALRKLRAFTLLQQEDDREVFQVAVIGAFTFTFKLGLKTLKDYLDYGGVDVSIPRQVIKLAFHHGLIDDGETWIEMLEDRNLLSHVYDEERASSAAQRVESRYVYSIIQVHDLLALRLEDTDAPCLDSPTI